MPGGRQAAQVGGHAKQRGRWGDWRQQQAAAAALQQALTLPTLSCRPLLIEAQLEPLFASLGHLLAGKAGVTTAQYAASHPDAISGDRVSTAGDAEVVGLRGAAGAGAWEAVREPVLRQLRAIMALYAHTGLNQALAYGLLFSCLTEVMSIRSPLLDNLAPGTDWRLATGACFVLRPLPVTTVLCAPPCEPPAQAAGCVAPQSPCPPYCLAGPSIIAANHS